MDSILYHDYRQGLHVRVLRLSAALYICTSGGFLLRVAAAPYFSCINYDQSSTTLSPSQPWIFTSTREVGMKGDPGA